MSSKKAAAIMLCAVLGTSMITGVSVSAKDKDELVLYTWDGMFPQEVLDDFEKETGKSRFTEKFSFIQDGRMTKRSCRFAFSIRYFVCI